MDRSTLQELESLYERSLEPGEGNDLRPIVIIGVGNITRSDDGLGPLCISKLAKDSEVLEGADVYDAGLKAFQILECLDGRKKAIIIDAISKGAEPGTIHRYDFLLNEMEQDDEIPVTMHDFTFFETIQIGKEIYDLPEKYVILGMEPKSLELGLDLSREVEYGIPGLIEMVKKELEAGI